MNTATWLLVQRRKTGGGWRQVDMPREIGTAPATRVRGALDRPSTDAPIRAAKPYGRRVRAARRGGLGGASGKFSPLA